MEIFNNEKELQTEIQKCMKCGNCQAVCPIFKETLAEPSVARGKIQLAKLAVKGKLNLNEPFGHSFMECLTCKACVEHCPSGVRVDKVVLTMRARLVRRNGLHLIKKSIFTVLKQPTLFRVGMNTGNKLQGLALGKVRNTDYRHPRFPLGLDTKRVMRPLANPSFNFGKPEWSRTEKPKFTAAFFTGCMLRYLYTDAAEAVVSVLNRNHGDVWIPAKQHCCGIPLFIHGDEKRTKAIAKYNIDVLTALEVDYIITHCGTCISAWRDLYPKLLHEDLNYASKAYILSRKTYDLAEFLAKKIKMEIPSYTLPATYSYHDPCHLVRGQGISREPREVLAKVSGLMLKEMQKPASCCGSAGSFSLTHYNLSTKIGQRKVADICQTEPDMVITSCGSCRMQLEDGLYRANSKIPVYHLAEVLHQAYESKNDMQK